MKTTNKIPLTQGIRTNALKTKKKPREDEKKKRKKKVLDEDGNPVRKKKKRKVKEETGTDMVVADALPEKKLTKAERLMMKKIQKRLKGLNSNFKDSVGKIHQMVSDDDIVGAMHMTSRKFILMLTELIPIAENNVRKHPGQSSIYALNALVSQVREIQADIKADSDQGQLAERIAMEVIGQGFHMLAQHTATSMYHLREQIRPLIPPTQHRSFDGTFNGCIQDYAKYLDQTRQTMVDKAVGMMTVGE